MIHWDDPFWSVVLGGGYLSLLTLQWGLLYLGVGLYGRGWRIRPPEEALPPSGPGLAVSVLVPARNEAQNIAACVKAILSSRHTPIELIVVDDASEDDTSVVAAEAAAGDPRFRVLAGRPKPTDWSGKAWALSQAAANAAHDRLLFLDADVTLHPDAVGAALARMEKDRVDLLSCFGTWRLESFWEHVVIPVVGWLIRGATNLDRVNDPAREDAFANGQFILVRREPYERVGGHGSVRAEVLDDVRLAQTFKRRGARTGMYHAPWLFSVRLYRSLGEIVDGYTKNLYEGMGRTPVVALGLVISVLIGSLLPMLLLIAGLLARLSLGWRFPGWPWLGWLAFVVLCTFGVRWRTDRADGRGPKYVWTYPLGNLVLAWIALRSMFKVDVRWKGRSFRDGKAEAS